MLKCLVCLWEMNEDASVCYGCGSAFALPDTMPQRTEESAPRGLVRAATKCDDPLVGSVLDSRYEIIERLGEGGIGTVYRARRRIIGDEVAVKVRRPSREADPLLIERFRWEARVLARLAHPNVVAIYDYGEGDGELSPDYIVMELLEGASLRAILRREGRLSCERAVALMCDVCSVVSAAHGRGILHRDLKPDNIIVLPPAEGRGREIVKLIDFGIARMDSPETDFSLTVPGQVLGAPFYMSPEQWRGERPDRRTDVYALGVTLYEMLCGEQPFQGQTLVELREQHLHAPPPSMPETLALPRALESVIRRALSKEPAQRQPDADVLARELREASDSAAAEAASDASQPPRRDAMKLQAFVLAAVPALVILVLLGLFFLPSTRPRRQAATVDVPESRRASPVSVLEPEPTVTPTNATPVEADSIETEASALPFAPGAPRKLYEIALTRDGRRLAAVDGAGSIRLFEPDAQSRTREHSTVELRRARSVALSLDAETLAAGSDDGTILILSLRDAGLRKSFNAHASYVFKLGFSPDGSTLVSAGGDRTVRRWRVSDAQMIDVFTLPNRDERIIDIDRLQQTLALLNRSGEIRLWSLESRQLRASFDAGRGKITCGVFSPNGEVLALGDERGEVRLWDARTGSPLGTLRGAGAASSVSFGAGGQTIATGWSDGRVRLFRASDGALLEVLEAGRAKVSCLALSADGGLLASGIGGESIRLWRIEERQRRTGGGTR